MSPGGAGEVARLDLAELITGETIALAVKVKLIARALKK
jgi:hypothetical protein